MASDEHRKLARKWLNASQQLAWSTKIDSLTELLRKVRLEEANEAIQIVESESNEFDVPLAVTKRKGDACKRIVMRLQEHIVVLSAPAEGATK